MTKEEFDKFVEQKSQDEKSAQSINWEKNKLEWLKQLTAFYSKVEEYLAGYIRSGQIRIKTSLVQLNEEHIGTYQAELKQISIGSDTIKLKPIGTLLIGAKGRVDMVGPAGTVKFILTGKTSNGVRISFQIIEKGKTTKATPAPKPDAPEEFVWKIATPPPKVRFIELEPETFFNALREVING